MSRVVHVHWCFVFFPSYFAGQKWKAIRSGRAWSWTVRSWTTWKKNLTRRPPCWSSFSAPKTCEYRNTYSGRIHCSMLCHRFCTLRCTATGSSRPTSNRIQSSRTKRAKVVSSRRFGMPCDRSKSTPPIRSWVPCARIQPNRFTLWRSRFVLLCTEIRIQHWDWPGWIWSIRWRCFPCGNCY